MVAGKRIVGGVVSKAGPYSHLLIALLAALIFLSVLRASLFSEVESGTRIWFELSFLLFSAILAEMLVVYFKQPTVMLLLVMGVLISPSAVSLAYPLLALALNYLAGFAGQSLFPAVVPHLVANDGFIRIFAQLGAIVLLFQIGLHSRINQVFNIRNLVVGLLGILLPFLGGFYYATMSGHGFGYALFLGAALTATSVGVTVAVLKEFGVLDSEFAKVILGAAVIDDVLALLMLSLVSNFPQALSVAALSPFAVVLGTAVVFIFGGITIGTGIVKRFFDKELPDHLDHGTYLGILAYVFAYAYVAEFIGLSAIVGAFVAGVTLNFSKSAPKLSQLFYPLEAFFTPIFFISLGMLVDVPALAANLVPILVITLIAIVTKVLGCGIGAVVTGSNYKDSLLIGVGMIPRGEIALIIGLYGLTTLGADGSSVLGPSEYAVIASMAFITTVIVPVLLQRMIFASKPQAA